MGAINHNGNTTLIFGGHNNLTFTSGMDLNSATTIENRNFQVNDIQGNVTFGGVLSNSSTAFSNITKSGLGTLVLSGANTFGSTASGVTNVTVSAGILQFSADNNLGTDSATANNVSLGGGFLEYTGAGSLIWNSASTNRTLNLTAASGIQVDSATGILEIDNNTTGAFALTKAGAGTLKLIGTANTDTTLTIGGLPTGGGVVSTTATSGNPFVASNGTVNLLGGNLTITGGGAAQALNLGLTSTLNYGSGSYITINGPTSGTNSLQTQTLTRTNQGTLTIIGTDLTNFGAGTLVEKLLVGGTAPATANGMLTVPTAFIRLAGTGAVANFATYGATNGFTTETNLASPNNITNPGVAVMADIAAGAAPVTATATGVNNALALRTANSITDNSGANLVIANGGLILNVNTANANAGVTISTANLTFGSVATPAEGIIYVADGTSSTPTISSAITATNLTKAGPGTLLLSGTGSVMAPVGTGLRNISINEGTLQFAGQSSLPSSGLVTISPMDTGTFDLNNQSLTIGGLGSGASSAITSTGNVINSGAGAQTLTLAVNNQTSTFSGLISGNISITKGGTGTQIFGGNNLTGTGGNTYTGTTTINAGNIQSAGGIYTESGTLQVNGVNSLGTNTSVTLAGGALLLNNAFAASDMIADFTTLQQGPGSGYNITVAGTNNFGTTNTTSILQTGTSAASLPSGVYEAFNNLTVNAPVLTLQQGQNNANITNGILIAGTTTFAGNTTLNVNNNGNTVENFVLAGTISAPTFTLTKIGSGNVTLTGTGGSGNGTGGAANNVGAWNIYAGTLEVRLSDGSSSPLGTNNVTLNGATLAIRHDGDDLADPENLTTFSGLNLVIGSTASVASGNYLDSANTTLNLGTLNNGNFKTIEINQLQFGGPLGTAFLTEGNLNNTYPLEALNGLTMIKDAYLSLGGSPVTLDGAISGNGTIFKTGTNELDINTVATNTGGTIFNQGNDQTSAALEGNTPHAEAATAQLGSGNITVNPSAGSPLQRHRQPQFEFAGRRSQQRAQLRCHRHRRQHGAQQL
ncbi:autotransporter-associated beta strand repeat protein [Chthoniobacter flavus Ellin428]|uniref:Autotransporter-associated beta strand repeat protein n=1 Tax=Chthoniobacter flavus Ellin428 TaxID=497964 RepID=B4D7T8_9BACT|nr:autotransporter-associated beta strand repeat protein [Chthoniobacter flavus Ellin428]